SKFSATSEKKIADDASALSPREIEVLKLMEKGASTHEAASALHLREYTVRDYVSTIMQKLGARNRTEAVAKVIRNNIIYPHHDAAQAYDWGIYTITDSNILLLPFVYTLSPTPVILLYSNTSSP